MGSKTESTASGWAVLRKPVSALLLLIPAVAIWHPYTSEGGPANLIVFWSWLYTGFGLFVAVALVWVALDSDDAKFLGRVCEAGKSRFALAAGIVLGGAWTFGAVYRGWLWTGAVLTAGWILGPTLQWISGEAATKRLRELVAMTTTRQPTTVSPPHPQTEGDHE